MKFLIPFKGRNSSEQTSDNILFQEKNIYIMDNHRLALWCWFQKLDLNESYNLFHIDAHPDMSNSANDVFFNKNIDMWNVTLSEYQTFMQEDYNIPLFRWDNYIQILLKFYPQLVKKENSYSATHKVGSKETLAVDISAYRLLSELNGIFSGQKFTNENKWIVNLDLDYFFSSLPDKTLMYSTEYLEAFAHSLRSGLDNEMIKVLTIALSPECCGGWEKAEQVLTMFTKIFEVREDLFHEN